MIFMEIAICDDLIDDRNVIKNYLNMFLQKESVKSTIKEFENGESLLENLKYIKYDIIFLDIYMTGEKGIDIAKIIKNLYPDTIIIFTTTSPDFAIESYSLNVEGYLLKPLQYESFKHIFSKYYEKFKSLYSFIVVTDKNKIPQKIFVNDIIFIEIYSRQCVFHTINSYIDSKFSINEFLDTLSSNSFYKVSRNIIINFKHVIKLENTNFILSDNSKIPIPVRRKAKCIDAYSAFLWHKS